MALPPKKSSEKPLKRVGEITLSTALGQWMDANQLRPKLYGAQINQLWETLLGQKVANQTQSLKVRHNKLYAKMESSVIRQEVSMIRIPLMNRLNEELGEEYIKEIVLC